MQETRGKTSPGPMTGTVDFQGFTYRKNPSGGGEEYYRVAVNDSVDFGPWQSQGTPWSPSSLSGVYKITFQISNSQNGPADGGNSVGVPQTLGSGTLYFTSCSYTDGDGPSVAPQVDANYAYAPNAP